MSRAITRRAFLAVPAAAAVACRGRSDRPFLQSAFTVAPRSAVALLAAATYEVDFADLIFRGLSELGVDVAGRSVLLKPNIVEYETTQAINTHPLVVAGAVAAFRRAGARQVLVGEGPGHRRDTEYLLTSSGLYEHLNELRTPFIDLNHDDVREVPTRSWYTGLRSLTLPTSVLAADVVVSMPKLKTHHWAGLTCSMKNLFGVVPGAVYGWPKNLLHLKGINASIVDIVATAQPDLAIVDGVVGMEGDGPIMGKARPLGLIAMGTDLPAVDATCARLIGIDPERLTYLKAARNYLGNVDADRIDHRGEPPGRFATTFELIDAWREARLKA
jgi:uncharacterized protein (DUF362 family)